MDLIDALFEVFGADYPHLANSETRARLNNMLARALGDALAERMQTEAWNVIDKPLDEIYAKFPEKWPAEPID